MLFLGVQLACSVVFARPTVRFIEEVVLDSCKTNATGEIICSPFYQEGQPVLVDLRDKGSHFTGERRHQLAIGVETVGASANFLCTKKNEQPDFCSVYLNFVFADGSMTTTNMVYFDSWFTLGFMEVDGHDHSIEDDQGNLWAPRYRIENPRPMTVPL